MNDSLAFLIALMALCATIGTGTSAQSLSPASTMTPPAHSTCLESEARQFDFWIGEWDIVNRYLVNGGRWVDAGIATNQVHPVLGGCGVVEHWSGNLGRSQIRGFSVRIYDPAKSKWVLLLSWPNPNAPGFSFLEGTFRHGRGEFFTEGTNAEGDSVLTRYSFSDISDSSLRWDAANSTDGGVKWSTNWIMEFERRDPGTDAPVLNAPSSSLSRCTQADMRKLDDLHGLWETAGRQPKSSGAISMRIMPILDGCAQMELLSVHTGSEPYEAFMIRAYLPDENAWRGYLVTTANRSFVELTGQRDGDTIKFTGDGTSVSYSLTGEGSMTLKLEADGVPPLEAEADRLTRR